MHKDVDTAFLVGLYTGRVTFFALKWCVAGFSFMGGMYVFLTLLHKL